MKLLFLATLLAPLLDAFDRWVESRAVNTEFGELLPEQWLLWGRIGHASREQISYFLVRLPSLDWRFDICRRREGWHQRALSWSSDRGWEVIYFPIYNQRSYP